MLQLRLNLELETMAWKCLEIDKGHEVVRINDDGPVEGMTGAVEKGTPISTNCQSGSIDFGHQLPVRTVSEGNVEYV